MGIAGGTGVTLVCEPPTRSRQMIRLRPAIALAGLALVAVPAAAVAAPTAPTINAPPAAVADPSLQVSWSPSTFDPLATGTRYTLMVSTVAGGIETPLPDVSVDAPTTQATVGGLQDETTYRLRVVASELPCLDPVTDPPAAACTTQAGEDGRVSSPASGPVDVVADQSAPLAGIELNGGATWTTEPEVATGLTASDATDLRMVLGSSSAAVSCPILSCGVPFSSSPAFTLPDGDGPKTVFARVVDEAGNDTVVSDGIGLDSTAPDLLLTTSALKVETGQTVQFGTSEATDTGSGLDESSFAWTFCDGCAIGATGRTASRAFDTPGTFLVTLAARDIAGNRGEDAFFLTVNPPETGPPPGAGGTGDAPAAGPGPQTTAAPPAAGRGTHRVVSSVRVLGRARVGRPVRVRVALKRRAKVTLDVLSGPGADQTLLKRWAPRKAFRKGATVYTLSPPTRAATRVLRVTAGGETRSLTFLIRP
jgi:PKD domain